MIKQAQAILDMRMVRLTGLEREKIDAEYAENVVILTDCIVPFPNFPADISMTNVDYVIKVDAIGDADKIAQVRHVL